MRRALALLPAVLALLLPAAPAAAARVWTEPLAVSPPDAEVVGASGVRTSADEQVVAWTEDRRQATTPLLAAVKPPGSPFGSVEEVAPDVWSWGLAADGAGRTFAAWRANVTDETGGPYPRIFFATRPPGKAFGAGEEFGDGDTVFGLAANARGDVALLFTNVDLADQRLYLSVRPAGSDWSDPQDVSGRLAGSIVNRPGLALTPSGEAIYAWEERVDFGEKSSSVKVGSRPLGGTPTPPQTISRSDMRGFGPRLAVDGAGRAVVAWSEAPPQADGGDVMVSTRGTAGPFASARPLGGNAFWVDSVDVGVSSSGAATVVWGDVAVLPGGGVQLGPVKAAFGNTDTGQFTDPISLSGDQPAEGPRIGVEADGAAVLAYFAFRPDELRAMRRPAGGDFGAAQPLTCPARLAAAIDLGIDGTGRASVLWRDTNAALDYRGLHFSEDKESPEEGPHACAPRPPPGYIVTPQPARPGETVTFDGSDYRNPDAPVNRWSWDLDGDGVFEIDESDNPIARRSFPAPGIYHVGFKPSWRSRCCSGSSIYDLKVQVVGENGGAPAGPEAGPLPVTSARGGASAPVIMRVRPVVALAEAMRLGIPVRLWSPVRRRVVVRVVGSRATGSQARRATRLVVLARRSLVLRGGRARRLRIPLRRRARRMLRKFRMQQVILEVRAGRTLLSRQPMTLRRGRR